MRVLVVLSHSGFFRHLDTVVTTLCRDGHEVKVLTKMARKGDEDDDYQDQMVASVAAYDHGSYDFQLVKRQDRLKAALRQVKDIVNYALYFRAQHNSPQLADRLAGGCPPRLRAAIGSRAGRRVLSLDGLWTGYRSLQRMIPADRVLVRRVAAERPDVVVGCPSLYPGAADVECLRAAQQLGIPTVVAVASWDNLSTKGALHLLPDRVLVWNQRLAEEAQRLHAIPPERVIVTGAAKFDAYFELGPTLSRERFCSRLGIDPARPYLLWLGSSHQVAGDETGFVAELARAVRADPRLSQLEVVVRPHPLNAAGWEGFQHPGITVFPGRGQRPDMPRHRDDYFNTLTYAAAAIGVNTTAFLEAAIADRPCLSIVSERHREGQVERGHFQHLLHGGFLEAVPSFEAAVETVAAILDGRDSRRAQRSRFVQSFVRPAGIRRPAGAVMAEAILAAAATGPAGGGLATGVRLARRRRPARRSRPSTPGARDEVEHAGSRALRVPVEARTTQGEPAGAHEQPD
jgi:hypothetical protein